MANSERFYAAADKIAYDLHAKLWCFVNEVRATDRLPIPHRSDGPNCYEMDADKFNHHTFPQTPTLPDLEEYRRISLNCDLGLEPLTIDVILRLPQSFSAATSRSPALIRSQIPRSIILETWKLSFSKEGLMKGRHIHHLTDTYGEHRRFFRDIHPCVEKLPSAKFARQVQDSQASSSPDYHGMAPEIILRLSSGSANAIEKQFVPCASCPLPTRTYVFPPIPHIYGNFVLSMVYLSNFDRLISSLSLWYPGGLFGILPSPEDLGIDEQRGFPSYLSKEQVEMQTASFQGNPHQMQVKMRTKLKLESKKFLPPSSGCKSLRLRDQFDTTGNGWEGLTDHPCLRWPEYLNVSSRCTPHPTPGSHSNADCQCEPKGYPSSNKVISPLPSFVNPTPKKLRFGDIPPTPRYNKPCIPIPPKKIPLDDDVDAQRYMFKMLMRIRRRAINSASTAASRLSPMIAGASNPFTPNLTE